MLVELQRFAIMEALYYADTEGIIFVIDSNDRERMDDSNGFEGSAKEELHRLLKIFL